MKVSKRQQKFSRMIQKDLGEIFQRDTRGIIGNALITIAEVRVSPDLSVAKVYISMMMVEDREGMLEKINERKSEIRKILGNRIGKQARVTPELIFYIDEVDENAMRLDDLITGLDIPPETDESNTSPQNKDKKED